jgi:hypothetical protein
MSFEIKGRIEVSQEISIPWNAGKTIESSSRKQKGSCTTDIEDFNLRGAFSADGTRHQTAKPAALIAIERRGLCGRGSMLGLPV